MRRWRGGGGEGEGEEDKEGGEDEGLGDHCWMEVAEGEWRWVVK